MGRDFISPKAMYNYSELRPRDKEKIASKIFVHIVYYLPSQLFTIVQKLGSVINSWNTRCVQEQLFSMPLYFRRKETYTLNRRLL